MVDGPGGTWWFRCDVSAQIVNMHQTIRVAEPSDGKAISAIYAPIVRDTVISFETVVPTAQEMAARVERTLETHPWLVAERTGVVVAYAYAGPHRTRAAYRWACDVSVYAAQDARRSGLGRRLYDRLFEILRSQRFMTAYAGITLPNDASVGLHEAMGFEPVGVYRNVGYKNDGWHDVGWWGLTLQSPTATPPEPLGFPQVRDTIGRP